MFIVLFFNLLTLYQVASFEFLDSCKVMKNEVIGLLSANLTFGCRSNGRFGYCSISRTNGPACTITVQSNYNYNRGKDCHNQRLSFTGSTQDDYCEFTINDLKYSGKFFLPVGHRSLNRVFKTV